MGKCVLCEMGDSDPKYNVSDGFHYHGKSRCEDRQCIPKDAPDGWIGKYQGRVLLFLTRLDIPLDNVNGAENRAREWAEGKSGNFSDGIVLNAERFVMSDGIHYPIRMVHTQILDNESDKERLLTGKELKVAAKRGLAVRYVEDYFDPSYEHMNYDAVCVLEEAEDGYYIGNSDINPDDFGENEELSKPFAEGTWSVYAVDDVNYTEED